MSYGLKYYTEFMDKFSHLWRVEFFFRDFSNPPTEVKTAAIPLTYSYTGDDRDITRPIFGKEAVITIMSEKDFQFIDFHAADSRSIRCDIKKDGVLDFSGWVLPDLFNEPYIAPPYPVSISCRCGLGELSETEMPSTIEELIVPDIEIFSNTITPTLLTIIGRALLSIDTDLVLNEAVNVYANEDDTINDSPLVFTRINLSAYEGKTYYEAISDILIILGARLYQMDGEWWLVRVKEMKETLTVRQWTLSAEGISSFIVDQTKLTTFQIGKPVNSNIISGATLDILPAWKKSNVIQTLGKVDNLLSNGDFSEYSRMFKQTDSVGNEYNVYPVSEWNYTPDSVNGDPSIRWDNSNEPYCYFRATPRISQTIKNFESGAYIIPPYATNFQCINLNLDYTFLAPFNTDIYYFKITVEIENETEHKYLKYNEFKETNNYEWTDTPSYIQLNKLTRSESAAELMFNSFGFTSMYIPIDGDVKVTIGDLYDEFNTTSRTGFLCLKNVVLKLVEDEGVEYEETETTTETINSNNIYTPSDIETVAGDLPDIPNNDKIWTNYFRLDDGTPTEKWHERDSAIELPIIELTQSDYKNFFYQPQFKLSLPILSENIKFDSCIVDYQVLPKKYICNSASIDVRNGIFTGTFIEFASWEGGNWILKDGVWSDEGVWIDDGEVWEDS